MKVTVFGSSGATGRLVVERALQAGHDVRAFVRDPDRLLPQHQSLDVAVGDALGQESVAQAIEGRDAVISALGVGMGSRLPVLSEGARNILRGMELHGARRLVCLSSYGSGDGADGASLGLRLFFKVGPRRAYADKRRQDEIIRSSQVQWVIARPTRFTDGPERGTYRVAERLELGMLSKISRADVASFLVAQLTEDRWLEKCPLLSY